MQKFYFHLLIVLSLFVSKVVWSQPPAPVLHPIDNTDGDDRYTVSWDTVSGGAYYWLAVDLDDQFVTNNVSDRFGHYTNAVNYAFKRKGTYYYRIRAKNDDGYSDWSNIESVTVAADPPHYMTSRTSVYGEPGPRTVQSESFDVYAVHWGTIITFREVTVTYDSTGNNYEGWGRSWQD